MRTVFQRNCCLGAKRVAGLTSIGRRQAGADGNVEAMF